MGGDEMIQALTISAPKAMWRRVDSEVERQRKAHPFQVPTRSGLVRTAVAAYLDAQRAEEPAPTRRRSRAT